MTDEVYNDRATVDLSEEELLLSGMMGLPLGIPCAKPMDSNGLPYISGC